MDRQFFGVSVFLIFIILSSSLWATEAIWIDVRSVDEYQSGHVSQAVHIPHTEIATRIEEVTRDKDAEIFVYCRSGRRSGIARETLIDLGYTNVVNAGGIEDARSKAAESQ